MHKHQHAYLVTELRKPEYAGKSADEVYAILARPPKSFLAVSFVPESKFNRVHPKLRGRMIAVSDEYAKEFPSGVAGMPNLIRREEFDKAWSEK